MGSAYTVLGRTVPAHHVSLATLGLVSLFVLPNPFSAAPTSPAFKASSKEEEQFINDYLKKAEEAEKKAEKH